MRIILLNENNFIDVLIPLISKMRLGESANRQFFRLVSACAFCPIAFIWHATYLIILLIAVRITMCNIYRTIKDRKAI